MWTSLPPPPITLHLFNMFFIQESFDDEYLENNCVDDPVKLCDFQLLENRIMKTVDSVYQVITDQMMWQTVFYSQ